MSEVLDALDKMHAEKLEAYRKLADEASAPGGAPSLVGWKPLASEALAVHPSQVKEAIADAKAKGVPTEFTRDGRPILTSRAHRKAYCKAYGFVDRNAGYGDAAPGSTRRAKERRPSFDPKEYDY